MLPLPILDVRLNACHEDWQQMTPTTQGHHCAQCNRTVLDFTTSNRAELEAAFRPPPDGRVCGRFRQSQLAPPPQLRPKLRRFLVALVLVCGLGLTSGEAWAQAKEYMPKSTETTWLPVSRPNTNPAIVEVDTTGLLIKPTPAEEVKLYVADQCFSTWNMPIYKKQDAHDDLNKFIKRNLKWPDSSGRLNVDGKVYVQFIIGEEGEVRGARVTQGLHPLFDAEALRVIGLLSGHFEAAKRNGRAMPYLCILPITFSIE